MYESLLIIIDSTFYSPPAPWLVRLWNRTVF